MQGKVIRGKLENYCRAILIIVGYIGSRLRGGKIDLGKEHERKINSA